MKPLGVRVVAAIINGFPSPFRERFGAEMLAAYLDQRDVQAEASRHRLRRVLHHDIRTIAGLLSARRGERREARLRIKAIENRTTREAPTHMQNFLSDLRHAVRTLRWQPAFSAVAILTLALGIGANTAVFSVLNSVILSPLPYREPEQLVRLYTASNETPDAREFLNGLDIIDVRDQVDAFSAVGIMYTYRESGADLSTPDGHADRVQLVPVSAEYFQTLGATPMLGSVFAREDERPDARRAILSHQLWSSLTNRDSTIIGKTIGLNGLAYEVVGVMRPGFRDPASPDVALWIPQNLTRSGPNNPDNYYLSAIARMKPGVTIAEARSRVTAFMRRLDEERPNDEEARLMRVVPLHEDMVGDSKSAVFILMGAAGLVLLIACLNVANLFLARSVAQSRDTAIRTALGAGSRRLVSQRLSESIVIAVAGGLVGSATAYWGVRTLLAVSPESLARAEQVGFDPLLLGFAIAVTVLTGLLFGAAPAIRATRADPNEAMHEGSRGNTGGRSSRRARSVLVASQVCVALMLLVGAGVLIRAFVAQQRVDLGFDPSEVTTFELNLPVARYDSAQRRVLLHSGLTDRLRAIPGVTAVGATSWLPAAGKFHQWGYAFLDSSGQRRNLGPQIRVIDGDFFKALGIPLRSGRTFGAEDQLDTPGVAIISQSLARAAYGDQDPLGRSFRTGGHDWTVIGVSGNVASEARGTSADMVYLSHDQFAGDRAWTLNYVIRSTATPERLIEDAREVLRAIDPALVLHRPRTMESLLASHRARDRFVLLLMTTFGMIALSLAAVGVYGVLAYLVSQRNHEIGVRMALGARPQEVRAIVMREGLLVAGTGMMIGLAGAAALSGVLQSIAPGAEARDPQVFAGATIVLALAVAGAAFIPARRATRVSPLEALRTD
jgi:predicted permease